MFDQSFQLLNLFWMRSMIKTMSYLINHPNARLSYIKINLYIYRYKSTLSNQVPVNWLIVIHQYRYVWDSPKFQQFHQKLFSLQIYKTSTSKFTFAKSSIKLFSVVRRSQLNKKHYQTLKSLAPARKYNLIMIGPNVSKYQMNKLKIQVP